MTYFSFNAHFARRIPDPVFEGLVRHVFVVPVRSLPKGLRTDPNARSQNIRTRVAREIKESLFNNDCEDGTFHLKNNGITIIAEGVRKNHNKDDEYQVEILERQGIVDGAHTYKIIVESLDDEELPEKQFVSVDILTGIKQQWIADISGGRNTTVQVARMSLDNLKGRFNWMKDELREEPFYEEIGWEENDSGEFDARDLIALLSLFNVDLYPNRGESHPTSAYSGKEQVLKRFQSDRSPFEQMRPILKDILVLHDTIRHDYRSIWNTQMGRNVRAGGLSISEKKRKPGDQWRFIFTGQTSEYRMVNGALYPILAAFRWFVRKDLDTGESYWRDGFENVLDAWENSALALLKATNEMSRELGYKPNAIGKSATHWRSLHQLVAMRDLQRT